MTISRYVSAVVRGRRRVIDLLALPQVILTTTGQAPIVSKEDYVNGTLTINGESPVATRNMQIRGRGNSTWGAPKKPYRIKLATAASLVPGVAADRDWVLLAAYYDPAYIRTMIGMEIAARTSGMEWNPSFRLVEVTLNGDYVGIYLLGEHVKVGGNRIPITVPPGSATSGIALTGGYSMELDFRAVNEEGGGFTTARNVPVAMDDPKNEVPEQVAYLQDWIGDFETRLFDDDWLDPVTGYRPLIDLPSTAAWFVATELTAIVDAGAPLSVKLYKKRDTVADGPGKLFFGPLWDLDNSMGNYFRVYYPDHETSWRTRYSIPWVNRMMGDPEFRIAVEAAWVALRDGLDSWLPAYIDRTLKIIQPAAMRDRKRWGWPLPAAIEPIRAELVGFFDAHAAWLDDALGTGNPIPGNLAPNPSFVSGTSHDGVDWDRWGGEGGVVDAILVPEAAHTGGWGYRLRWTTGTTAPSGGFNMIFAYGDIDIEPGQVYSAGMWVRSSIAQKVVATIAFYPADTSHELGRKSSTVYTLSPGQWTRVQVEGAIAPALTGAAAFSVMVDPSGSSWAPNDTFDADLLALVPRATIAPPT